MNDEPRELSLDQTLASSDGRGPHAGAELALAKTQTPLPPALEKTLTPLPLDLDKTRTPAPDFDPGDEHPASPLLAPTMLSNGDGSSRRQLATPPSDEDRRAKDLVKARLFRNRAQPVKIGRFTVLDRLGEGGMGRVYLARESHPARDVALKVVRTGMMSAAMVLNYAVVHTDLDVLAITDHNTLDGWKRAREFKERPENEHLSALELVPGIEVSTRDGHVIGLWVKTMIPRDLSAAETIAAIHEQGGMALAPHPYAWLPGLAEFAGVGDLFLELPFDAVEVRNSTPTETVNNHRTAAANRRRNSPHARSRPSTRCCAGTRSCTPTWWW